MVAGDYHVVGGNGYYETEMGPLVTVTCDDCGRSAAASIEYIGPVRCVACWRWVHGLDHELQQNFGVPLPASNGPGAVAHKQP